MVYLVGFGFRVSRFDAVAECNFATKKTVFPDSDPGSIHVLSKIGACMDSQSSWERHEKVVRQQHPCFGLKRRPFDPKNNPKPETRNPKPETDHINSSEFMRLYLNT